MILIVKTRVFVLLALVLLLSMAVAYKLKVRNKLFFGLAILAVAGILAAFVWQEIRIKQAIEQARRDLGVSVLAVNFTDHDLQFEFEDWSGSIRAKKRDRGQGNGSICCYRQKKNGVLVKWNYKDKLSQNANEKKEIKKQKFEQFLDLPLNKDVNKSLYVWFFDDGKLAMKYILDNEMVPVEGDGDIEPVLYGDGWTKNFAGDTP